MKTKYSTEELERIAANPWLTDRERQVFELRYRRGWVNEDIAAELYVSRSTIDRVLREINVKAKQH